MIDKTILDDEKKILEKVKAFNVAFDPITPPSPIIDANLAILKQIKQIVYGKTYFFYKKEIGEIKKLLLQANI